MTRLVYVEARAKDVVPEVCLPDLLFLFGDTNYCINGCKKSILQAIQQNRFDMLLKCDQFELERAVGNIPSFFKEGQIAFAPTFERKPYDNLTFGTKQNPAWNDRILYHSNCGEQPSKLE